MSNTPPRRGDQRPQLRGRTGQNRAAAPFRSSYPVQCTPT